MKTSPYITKQVDSLLHPSPSRRCHGLRGYVLFEVILALTVFAFAVLGLANALNTGIEAAGILNKENDVRIALRSFIEEMRRKPVAEMATEIFDARLQAKLVSTVEELTLKDRNGTALSDLYLLKAQATYGEGNDAREETVDVYVYKPEITEE
jgi:Tfp pilus assembly protein PilV